MRGCKITEVHGVYLIIIAIAIYLLFYTNRTYKTYGDNTIAISKQEDKRIFPDKQQSRSTINSNEILDERKYYQQLSSDFFVKQLVSLENQFGGKQIVKYSPRKKWSKFDTMRRRTQQEGGDRMSPKHHNYGIHYAKYLSSITREINVSAIAEIGILTGTGVAIFSDLFPSATVYGFDIDLENIMSNMKYLKERGAFKNGNLKLQVLDQFKPNLSSLGNIKFDMVIDDATHNDAPILSAFKTFYPQLQRTFLYVVEDCVCQSFRNHIKQHYKELVTDYISINKRSQIIFIYPKHFDI